MRLLSISTFVLLAGTVCFGQQWELGVSGGVGIYKNGKVQSGSDSADAGFKTGPAVSVFASQIIHKNVEGQIRYTFQFDDLRVSKSGTDVTFSGQSHAIHYDLLYLFGQPEHPIRAYVFGGGGVKVYRGTGKEVESQPLEDVAILTRTQEVKPLATFGGGVKAKLGNRGFLYIEARDYLTPFPTNVVTPVPPYKASGWIHDIVPMVGLSFSF